MLIFKNNIYDRHEFGLSQYSKTQDIEYDAAFNPLNLLSVALKEEKDVLDFFKTPTH